jgi:hypothetical protein
VTQNRSGSKSGEVSRSGNASPVGSGLAMDKEFPVCKKCDNGILLPLSDYGRDGAPITYKAWVCNNPGCGFNIRIDNGEISFGRPLGQSLK